MDAPAPPESPSAVGDWRDRFYLNAFLVLSTSDRQIERRELVWIKRFFAARGKEPVLLRLEELVAAGQLEAEEFEELVARATVELSTGEKRRFVYNLAQLCKSKGTLSNTEYERIVDLAEQIGVRDIDADAIINSVYSINDSFFAIIGILALGVILYTMQVVIVPLVIATFITMIITQVESQIARGLRLRRFRWLNKVAAMVVILGVLFGLVMAAAVSGRDIATRLPYYEEKLNAALEEAGGATRVMAWAREKGLVEQLKQLPIASTIRSFLGSLASLVGNFLLVVIFTGFLVFSTSSFSGILQEMNDKISAYISIKTMVSLLTGVVVYVLCLLFGVDFALFWAMLGFLLNFIPSVGSIIASIPPLLLSMVQLSSWASVAVFGAIFIAAQVLLGQVLEPKLMGSRLAVKPVAILLGLIFWGFLWGIPGMFLAAPLMALLRILSSYFNFSRSFERLLAAE